MKRPKWYYSSGRPWWRRFLNRLLRRNFVEFRMRIDEDGDITQPDIEISADEKKAIERMSTVSFVVRLTPPDNEG